MLEELDGILNDKQFDALMEAIQNHQKFNLDSNGLNIKVNPSENAFEIVIKYDRSEKEQAHKLAKEFQEFIQTVDDDIFVETCERIPDLRTIQDCVNSDKLETVRAGILKFKSVLKVVISDKIEMLQACLHNLEK